MPPNSINRVGENILWLIGDKLFRIALGVVVLGAIARYLGLSQFGVLNYAVGLMAIFASVASLGIEGIVIRELVKSPNKASVILGTAFVLRCSGAIFAVGLVFLSGLVTRNSDVIAPLALVVSLAFLPQSFEVIDLWFQKNIQSKFTVMAKGLAALLGAGVKISLVLWKAPLMWFGVALAFDAVFNAVVLVYQFRLRGQSIRAWTPSIDIARVILRDSWPLIFSGFLVAVYMRVEQVLVMNFLGEASAGVYYAATRITEVWLFVPGLILSSVYPLLVEKRHNDLLAFRAQMQNVFDLLTGLGFGIAVGATVLAPFAIPLIYGPKYTGAISILLILAWGAPVVFSGSARAQYFLLENLTIYHTWSALIGIATNTSLALWLMPRFGARGAAMGAIAGYCISAYATSLVFSRLRECGRLQTKAFLLLFRLRQVLDELRRLLACWKIQSEN